METKTSKGKEIRIPEPDHPITISPAEGRARVTVAGRIVAESTRALRLEEKGYPPVYYLPRKDAGMWAHLPASAFPNYAAGSEGPTSWHQLLKISGNIAEQAIGHGE